MLYWCVISRLLLFALLFTLLNTAVLKGPLVFAEPGLYPISNQKVPEIIREKSNSVFQILVITTKPVIEIPKSEYPHCTVDVSKENLYYKLLCDEVKKCREKIESSCPIYFENTSTGFLAQDSHSFWSARHVFDGAIEDLRSYFDKDTLAKISEEIKFKALFSQPLRIRIYDQNTQWTDSEIKPVFDTTWGTDKAYFEILGDPKIYQNLLKNNASTADPKLISYFSDFTKIKLNRSLDAPALKFSDRILKEKEPTYVLGFPAATHLRMRNFHAPDSSGWGLRASIGQVIAPDPELLPNNDPAWLKKLNQFLMTFDADTVYGQSGGPILDKAGQVVAIISNHSFQDQKGGPSCSAQQEDYSARGGIGVQYSGIDYMIGKYPLFSGR